MILRPGQKGTDAKGEFFSILSRFGLKPTSPDFKAKTDMRQHTFSFKKALILAGVATILTVTWTLTYDYVSKGILEAKRATSITDNLTGVEYVTATVVFLTTTGGATWTKDGTWNNAVNTVEAIGTGSDGNAGPNGKIKGPGSGGSGAAYTYKSNVSLSGNPPYTIPAAIANPANVTFNTTEVVADSGNRGTGFAAINGGLAANCTPSANAFDGGASGNVSPSGYTGGGGAAGPHGAGGPATVTPGVGGTGDNGNTAADTAGTQWDATHGSGGGGSNAAGKLYGAGGAGGASAGAAGFAGAQGLIVLTWTPAAGAKGSYAWFL